MLFCENRGQKKILFFYSGELSLKINQPHAVELLRGCCEVADFAAGAACHHQCRGVIRPAYQIEAPLDREGGDICPCGIDDGEVHTDTVVCLVVNDSGDTRPHARGIGDYQIRPRRASQCENAKARNETPECGA